MNTVVITGGGTGLGRELAIQYSSSTHHVVIIGRNEHSLQETKQLIENTGHSASYIVCDLQNVKDIQAAVTNITKVHTVSLLINNSGVGYFGELEKMEDNSILAMINTNILGTIFTTKYFLPYLKKARILNIISTAGLRGKVNEAVYCASKFAIRGFTEALQKELENSTIQVTAVYMGGMDTPFWENSTHISDKSRLKSPVEVAKQIKDEDVGNLEIIIT